MTVWKGMLSLPMNWYRLDLARGRATSFSHSVV